MQPREVIHEVSGMCLRTERVTPVPAERAAEPPPTGLRYACSACGALIASDSAQPVLRKGDARLCAGCWSQLSAPEVEGVVRAVALRGVPLS